MSTSRSGTRQCSVSLLQTGQWNVGSALMNNFKIWEILLIQNPCFEWNMYQGIDRWKLFRYINLTWILGNKQIFLFLKEGKGTSTHFSFLLLFFPPFSAIFSVNFTVSFRRGKIWKSSITCFYLRDNFNLRPHSSNSKIFRICFTLFSLGFWDLNK